jgi:DNA repair protein RadD
MLRDYQQRAIDMLAAYFDQPNAGDPCLVLPTGSGKSHVIAEWCKWIVSTWPDQRILMLTHVKELIEQNAAKMRQHWPDAPLGIYSAGLRQRQAGQPITFAGIQSVARKPEMLGIVDLVIVDEAHRISHTEEGGYRKLIDYLRALNPAMRVIGLTATPYRLGHGYITDKPALFSDLIEPIGVIDLVRQGYLSPLRSLATAVKYDLSNVKKRGGEYVEADLNEALNRTELNESVAEEILQHAGDRRSWLVFCVGVDHAYAMAGSLRALGVSAGTIVGETPAEERAELIRAFRAGEITALTNANVLTTGFDAPNVDLIAACRPTMSTSLYVQMLGRGTRLKEHIKDCLVLDFAGLTYTHGFFDKPEVKKPKGGTGEAPVKVCPACNTLCYTAVRECPQCGYKFPPPKPPKLERHDGAIMSDEMDPQEMQVRAWRWDVHTSASGQPMLRVRYYPIGLMDEVPIEYFTIWHGGAATYRATENLRQITNALRISMDGLQQNDISILEYAPPPRSITYRREGKFYRIVSRAF